MPLALLSYFVEMILGQQRSDNEENSILWHKSNDNDQQEEIIIRSWDQLPSELVVTILKKLDLADSIRLSAVCKHWGLIAKENKLRNAQVTWLMLPHDHDEYVLRFYDLSDGVFYDIKLPKTLQGGCCCGSSKGWLVFMVEGRSKFDPKLLLFNPISGKQIPLPCIASIPSFATFVDDRECDNNVAELAKFIIKVELSSTQVDAPNCIVAAATMSKEDTLEFALCKPGDKKWTVFERTDQDDARDILFYNGELHVLLSCNSALETHTIKVGDHENDDDIILRLIPNNWKTIFETPDVIYNPEDESQLIWTAKDYLINSYLVESSDGELLIVHKTLDGILYDGGDEEHEGEGEGEGVIEVRYNKVSRYEVFKIDHDHPTRQFTKLNSLGNQTLCVSEASSLCIPAGDDDLIGLKKNCIYFVHDSNHAPNISCESGVFHLEDGRIQRFVPSRISIPIPTKWFIEWLLIEWFLPEWFLPNSCHSIHYPMIWFSSNLSSSIT